MSYVKNPDRRTDRIMIANTRLALRAVARKNQPNQLIREHYPQFTAYNLQHAIDKWFIFYSSTIIMRPTVISL